MLTRLRSITFQIDRKLNTAILKEDTEEPNVDQSQILLEYLKEQYTQSRQHESRQSTATAFLLAAAGTLIGFAIKDEFLKPGTWWLGLVIFLLGAANAWINHAHFRGNRFHVKLAGKVRKALEDTCTEWTVQRPTALRQMALQELGLNGPDVSIGKFVYRALQIIPVFIMAAGLLLVILSLNITLEIKP